MEKKILDKVDTLLIANSSTAIKLSELKKDLEICAALGIDKNTTIAKVAEIVREKFAGLFEVTKIGRTMMAIKLNHPVEVQTAEQDELRPFTAVTLELLGENQEPVNQIAEPAQDTASIEPYHEQTTLNHGQEKAVQAVTNQVCGSSVNIEDNYTLKYTQQKIIRVVQQLTHKNNEKTVSVPTLYKAMSWKGKKPDRIISSLVAAHILDLEYAPLDGSLIDHGVDCASRYRNYRVKLGTG